MSIEVFEQQFTVGDCEADCARRMTLGAILRRAQQIATDHCTSLGITAADYARTQTAFLMAKLALESEAPIHIGDTVTLRTRPFAPRRAVYNRLTEFLAPDGALLCTVDSRWVLVSTETKRILRAAPAELHLPFGGVPEKELDVSVARGEAVPLPLGEETARFTRCDSNRHLNNTHYADIVCDHMPLDLMETKRPVRLAVLYHNEVPMGASFLLSRAQLADGSWYFCGNGEEKKHFEAQLTLED